MNTENKSFLKDFVAKLKSFRTPATERAYNKYGNHTYYPVKENFTLNEIRDLLRQGSPEQLRELSRYYYRTSGIYRNAIDLYASMSKYATMITPVFEDTKTPAKAQVINTFNQVCKFVEKLHIPVNFSHIMREILLNGVYYGILRKSDNGYTFQDLPVQYCRVRFKDENDLEVIEFNVCYFDTIRDLEYQKLAVASYPEEIQQAWANRGKKLENQWVELGPAMGGVAFSYGDRTPPFASAIPSIYQLDAAVDREADRDENELYKLLIQKMPIDSKGELVFQMDEVQDIHESVANMLSSNDTVNVLTTFGDTSLESLQDSTAASQSTNRIEKYTSSAYDELGISEVLFNCDNASGLDYSIKRQEVLVNEINNKFSVWIRYLINRDFSRPKFSFDFEILPIDIFNQKEVQEKYFQAAQYGYSKMYAGVAMGIKQQNQISLLDFENEILNLDERMIPLQSTYTSSANAEVEKEKNESDNSTTKNDITNGSSNENSTTTEKEETTNE